MRDKIVAGNWKMNNTLEEAKKLASEVVNMVNDEVTDNVKVIMAPSHPYLSTVKNLISTGSKISLSAQNCHHEVSGAYTGEVSSSMLKSIGCDSVIIGHSERREYFNETNAQLAQKVDLALSNGLTPIFCCGESLEIRESGKLEAFVNNQLTESIFHLSESDFSKLVIAYEPIWAIGTGVTASSQQAQDIHKSIRNHIASKYGNDVAQNTSILYGGSCKPSNAQELFACEDVDGGLIGGASLSSRDFVDIVKSF